MLKKLNENIALKDSKGIEYKFDMYSYDSFDDIDDAVKDYKHAGLYVFAKRSMVAGKPTFKLSYLGETGDYSTRDYSNHHKRKEIESSGANEFGICLFGGSDAKRMELEADLIATNNPSCNG